MPSSFEELAPDSMRDVFNYLPPDDLLAIRGTNANLVSKVDDFVNGLTERGELVNNEGFPVSNEESAPSVLNNWNKGLYARSVAEIEALFQNQELVERYDSMFSGVMGQGSIQVLVKMYYTGETGEGELVDAAKALTWKGDINTYTQQLLAVGRLRDSDGEIIPWTQDCNHVIESWIDGDVDWSSKPKATS